ncbi:unnamed protein product [marine sediment metagenome]|uniref:HTH cro/C1-type domain-containing protein n=1 Tax=marine sediment metagenome TaxID=412755 RepID=X1JTL4_9ZZZZ
MIKIGQKIRKLRDEKNYTLEELGKLSNLDPTSISRFENNKAIPHSNSIKKLASAFHISIDYLLSDSIELLSTFLEKGVCKECYESTFEKEKK